MLKSASEVPIQKIGVLELVLMLGKPSIIAPLQCRRNSAREDDKYI